MILHDFNSQQSLGCRVYSAVLPLAGPSPFSDAPSSGTPRYYNHSKLYEMARVICLYEPYTPTTECVMAGLRRSSKYSFHRPIMSSVEVSSLPTHYKQCWRSTASPS
ncbi:hypothetical protein GOODEAATRI_030294 [Goodea atripinnis]|uniref:Uncharacterized protein n=1 Tax=Goodea atripinnis TaxID=208336 RepID=A0ABV0MYG2_9TELE